MILALAAVPLLLLQLLVLTTYGVTFDSACRSSACYFSLVRSFVHALPCRHRHRHRETGAAALKNIVEV